MSEQKRLDRPELREKILGILSETHDTPAAYLGYDKGYGIDLEPFVDQILALIPDVEEAKKQERERIRKEIMAMYDGTFPAPYNEAIRRMWQALQGETDDKA